MISVWCDGHKGWVPMANNTPTGTEEDRWFCCKCDQSSRRDPKFMQRNNGEALPPTKRHTQWSWFTDNVNPDSLQFGGSLAAQLPQHFGPYAQYAQYAHNK